MTLLNIITAVKERFPSADAKDICRLVNELESRLNDEIFSPFKIECSKRKLDVKSDMNTPLFLGEENISLYVYFIYSILSLEESDFECSSIFSTVFNKKFSELAAAYRRNHLPRKNTLLKGDF